MIMIHIEDQDECIQTDTAESSGPHTVVFKCIGATRDQAWQISLRIARDKMQDGQSVPVCLQPEPDYIKDPNAISFECCIDGTLW